MNETHLDLSKALIASVLDMPGAMEAEEIARITPLDVSPAFSPVWDAIRQLHRQNNLSVTSLVSTLQDETYSLYYFNQIREQYRDVSLDDLRGIADALKRHTDRRELDALASWLATAARNGQEPRDVARECIERLTPVALQSNHDVVTIGETLAEIYREIEERSANPSAIWGIPYPFERLNQATGGKQKGELILFAGEPKVGKSWWTLQDALYTAKQGIPVAIFSLEMRRKQVTRRLLKLEGLDGKRSRSGYMTPDDWEILSRAIGELDNLPIYIDDRPLSLYDIRPALARLKAERGIEQFVLDYSLLVGDAGKDEIEKTSNVSRECKAITHDLDIAGVLIASVNKAGMDATSMGKANVRGSGQQIHDADIVYLLTKYAPEKDKVSSILPEHYEQFVTLHVAAGRELETSVPGGFIHYRRVDGPAFTEWKQ